MKELLTSLLLIAFAGSATALPEAPSLSWYAESAASNFAKGMVLRAEPAKARVHFNLSAHNYAQLYQQGVRNPDLCRNWGNAEFLADHLPQAVLAWRLGLELAPNDADLLANLEYARDQVEYPPGNFGRPPPNAWPAWLPFPQLGVVVLAALAAYTLTWLLAAGWFSVRWPYFGLFTVCGVVATVALTATCVVLALAEQDRQRYPLVVVVKEHPLRRGNGNSYPAHDKIPFVRPGMEARLLFQKGDWLQIEFAGAHIGWVPRSMVLEEPRTK